MSKPFRISMESLKPTPLPMKRSARREQYSKAAESLSVKVITTAIQDEIKSVDENLERAEKTAELLDIARTLTNPTEQELQLLDIAQYMTQPTDDLDLVGEAPAMEGYTVKNHEQMTAALEARLQLAQESILSTMADVWTAFKSFLAKIGFKLRTYSSQMSKLRSILSNLRRRSNKESINVELKASPLMFTGKDDGYELLPVGTTKDMADGLITYCKHYDKFSNAYATALYMYSARYGKTFSTLFNSEARQELFFEELKNFSAGFFESVIKEGELTVGERKGLVVLNRSPVGICGSFFGVTSPGEGIWRSTDINSILRSFDEYRIEADEVEFDPAKGGKTKVISVSLTDVERMLEALELTMNTLDNLVTDKLSRNIDELEQFVDMSIPSIERDADGNQTTESKIVQVAKISEVVFKKTNAVARLQVMQAHVAIDGFRSIYEGLVQKLDQVIPFCYEALNKTEWYEQEIGL